MINDLDLHTPEGSGSGLVDGADAFSTMVEMEIQFIDDPESEEDNVNIGIFSQFFTDWVIQGDWVNNTIWTNNKCLTDPILKILKGCRIEGKYINIRMDLVMCM